MKYVILFAVCCVGSISQNARSQNVQWASKVLEYSSQYSTTKSSAQQALGKPNSLPAGVDSPMAWAVEETDDGESGEEAKLKLGYSAPMKIQQIAIGESCAPSAIERVVITDTDGDEHEIYKAEPQSFGGRGRMLNIFFPMTPYKVEAITITLQPGKVSGWNEIDAVGISDSKDSVKATIHLATSLAFDNKPENLGRNVNSIYSDAVDAISPDGKTLFISRTEHPENIGGAKSGRDVWYSTLRPDGTWGLALNIGRPINNKGNNFVNTITPDGNTLLLGNRYDADGNIAGEGVSMTHRSYNGWSMPENLEIQRFENKGDHTEYGLSPNGKVLLLAIQTDDNYGMNDLYVSFLTEDGDWTEPKNIGPAVNSAGDETGPFIAADGVTLYYSTNGISGFGNNDIFLTRRLDDTWTKWSEPENLGSGINTPKFDAYYSLAAVGDYAYFSSSASGSIGEEDVYRIKLPQAVKPKPVVLVSGKVYDSKTHQPIEAAIKYEALSGSTNTGIARSNPITGEYTIVLPAGNDFGFRAEAKNYYPISENLNTSKLTEYKEITKDLYLAPIEVGQTIRLNNIFFEFAKADLKPESSIELDRVVKFLNEHSNIDIQLTGHTDNVGNDAANLTLSDNRAQSVLRYIVAHGIASSRLSAKGYGRTKPIATNETDEGRQLNRRVEFTILKQ